MKVQAQLPCALCEALADKICVGARSCHSAPELGIVTFATPQIAHAIHHMTGPVWKVPLQPVLEQLIQFQRQEA